MGFGELALCLCAAIVIMVALGKYGNWRASQIGCSFDCNQGRNCDCQK